MTYTSNYQAQNNGSSVYSPFNRTAGAAPPQYQGYPGAVPASGFGAGVPATQPSMGPDVYLPPANAQDIDTLSGSIDNKIAQIRQAFTQQAPGAPAPGMAPGASAVPQADVQWALELENKVKTQNYQPNPQEVARYENIAQRLTAQQQQPAAPQSPAAPSAAPQPAPSVPQADIQWALELENKVKTQNYQPNPQEVARYEDIARRLSSPQAPAAPASAPAATAPQTASSVPQADVQWALELENKVKTQNYQPNPQEVARYEDIARRLSAPQAPAAPAGAPPSAPQQAPRNWSSWGQPFGVPAAPTMPLPIAGPGGQAAVTVPTSLRGAPQTPPSAMLNQQPGMPAAPAAASVSQQEVDWALQLEQKVNTQNYQPNPQEMAQYQSIAQRLQASRQGAPAAVPPQAPATPPSAPPQMAPAAAAGVSQPEIDWALQLEQKVNTQNYQPNPQEMAQYQSIAQRLQAARQGAPAAPPQAPVAPPQAPPQMMAAPQAPPQMAPAAAPQAPLPAGLSQQEIDWALQLEQKVNTQNYQPNPQEMAAYQNIANRINQQVAAQQQAPQAPQMPPQQAMMPPAGPQLPNLPPAPPAPQMQQFTPQPAPQVQIMPQNYPVIQGQTPQMLVPPAPLPNLPGPQSAPPYQQPFPPQGMPPGQQQPPQAGVMGRLKNAWSALWN